MSRLNVGSGLVYEERFERTPYLAANSVFLFAGDNFGINVTVDGDRISAMSYQKDAGKADVAFRLTQEKTANGSMMMLVLQNRLKRPLAVDGVMTVPGKRGIYKTNILPVRPGLSTSPGRIRSCSWCSPICALLNHDEEAGQIAVISSTRRA